MSQHSEKTRVTFTANIRNKAGDLITPGEVTEVRFWRRIGKATREAFTLTAEQVTRLSDGTYEISFLPTSSQRGVWKYDWETEGQVEWSDGGEIRILAQHTAD